MISFSAFVYFLAAVLLIFGLKRMSSPKGARDGIVLAGLGMLLAVVVTLFAPQIHGLGNYALMMLALLIGAAIALYSGKRVAMTDMPQMIALYNGMGGGAAGAIAAIQLLQFNATASVGLLFLALLGAYIGLLSFSGSLIAYGKLQGLLTRTFTFPLQNIINAVLTGISLLLVILLLINPLHHGLLLLFFVSVLALGIILTLPIGGANMPVVISLFNAMTGLAVAFEGAVLGNNTMIIAGTVVGASGTLLTQLMAKAMNQSIKHILFQAHHVQSQQNEQTISGNQKPIDVSDAAVMLAYAKSVIIIPGYGLAVAQAQHKVWEMALLLEKNGTQVKFAIHPVAGRMPGHMNVLLAEAGVPYDKILDMDEINADFKHCDVAIVIGANDVVNPAARTDPNSPIYGMPILAAEEAKNVLVVKRGQGTGFSGIENQLFYTENTRLLYGDGQTVVTKLIHALKNL